MAEPSGQEKPAEPYLPFREPGQSRVENLRQTAPPMESTNLLKTRRKSAIEFEQSAIAADPVATWKKLAIVAGIIAGGLAVAYLIHDLYQTKKQQAVEFEPASMSRDNLPAPPPLTLAEQNEIKDLVQAFHQAGSAEAKAAMVADGLSMLAPMRSFYTVHGTEPSEISLDPHLTHVEQGEVNFFRGTGAYSDGRTIEFYVRRHGEEFVLDGPSLSGYSAMNWGTFLTEKPALPMEFRVLASKVSARSNGGSREIALSLHSSRGEEKVIGYADAASLAGGELNKVFAQYGESPVKLTLKLAYAGYQGSDPRLVVTEVVRKDWLALASVM